MNVHTTETEELATIVESARRLQPGAFDRLVELYSHRLYGFLYRLTGRRDEAEELVQEVYVRVVRSIGDYVHDGRFEAWLFRIAANLARDRVRKLSRTPEATSIDVEDATNEDLRATVSPADRHAPAPDRELENGEQVDAMHAALATLPGAEREVIMLRHYGQLSFAEIAAIMETPLGTALARAHRGLAKLRSLLECQKDQGE